ATAPLRPRVTASASLQRPDRLGIITHARRSRAISRLEVGFVCDLTVERVNAYFTGLLDGAPTRGRDDPFLPRYERFLSRRYRRRGEPGQLLFVLGTGRNGSTSMAHALRRLPDGLVTHERPPLLHWHAPGPRLDFHAEFLRISREYFAIVGDVSHWWLPHVDALAEALGPVKVV